MNVVLIFEELRIFIDGAVGWADRFALGRLKWSFDSRLPLIGKEGFHHSY